MPRRNHHASRPYRPSIDQLKEIRIMNEIAERHSFKDEARYQGSCQAPDCEKPRAAWDAHHVVYEQHVSKAAPDKIWDSRNALRLCKDCHKAHHHDHSGDRRLPASVLPASAFDFALDIMTYGQAVNYFSRYYRATVEEVERLLA